MKTPVSILLIFLLSLVVARAQGNLPIHMGTSGSGSEGETCTCFRLGVEVGTSLYSTWQQQELFTPTISGSPLLAMGSTDGAIERKWLPLGVYAGVDFDLHLTTRRRLHLRAAFSRDRIQGEHDGTLGTVDIATADGVRGGTVQQTNAHGTVDYIETGITAEQYLGDEAGTLGGQLFIQTGLAFRSRISELEWSWHDKITNPVGGTFVGSVSGERDESVVLKNVARLRGGVIGAIGIRWQLARGVYLPLQLVGAYWFPAIAGEETTTDNSAIVSSGSALTVQLSHRDLQNWVSLHAGLSFDL